LPTPIVLDLSLSSRRLNLTSAESGVLFDIDGDGDLDHVAWTERYATVGFVVFDRNQNGRIDGGEELFGNAFRLSTGRRATNGFEALADLDRTLGNGDGVIDLRDPAHEMLQFWIDVNHDGVSQAGELNDLADVGVVRLETRYRESRRTDQYGNLFRYYGKATIRHGARDDSTSWMVDVILKVAPGSTQPRVGVFRDLLSLGSLSTSAMCRVGAR